MKKEIKDFIEKYRKMGFNLIPIKGKIPWDYDNDKRLLWKYTHTQIYPIEKCTQDIDIGVVTGTVSRGLVAFDLDYYEKTSGKYRLRPHKERELLDKIWNEWKDKTYAQLTGREPNKRLFFRTDIAIRKKMAKGGIEIFGEAGQVVLAPSIHPDTKKPYREYNDLPIMDWHGNIAEDFKKKYNLEFPKPKIDIKILGEGKLQGLTRNEAVLALTAWYQLKGHTEAEIRKQLEKFNQLPQMMDNLNDVFSAMQYQLKRNYKWNFVQDPKKDISIDDLAFDIDPNEIAIDVCGGANSHIIYEGIHVLTKSLQEVWVVIWSNGKERGMVPVQPEEDSIEIDGRTYLIRTIPIMPMPGLWTAKYAHAWVKGEYPQPNLHEVYKNVKETYAYFVDDSNFQEHQEGHRIAIACRTIGTFFFDAFPQFPYDAALGVFKSGKTQHMRATGYQSYHASQLFTVPTSAIMFRIADTCNPTILLDNAEQMYDYKKMNEESTKIVELFDSGAQRGATVYRCEPSPVEGRFKVRRYRAYCPKNMTSTQGFAPSLLSRAIITKMMETENIKGYTGKLVELDYAPRDRTQSKFKSAQIQRNRNDLYVLRMIPWKRVQAMFYSLKPEDFGMSGRNWDLWAPIFTICKIFAPKDLEKVIGFAKHLMTQVERDYIPEEYMAMTQTLIDMCPEEGWYKLKSIANAYAVRIGVDRISSKKASAILNQLGHYDRKRMGEGGYYHAYISAYILHRNKNIAHLEDLREEKGKPIKIPTKDEDAVRSLNFPIRVGRENTLDGDES